MSAGYVPGVPNEAARLDADVRLVGWATLLGYLPDAVEVRYDDDGVPGVYLHPVAGGSEWLADFEDADVARFVGEAIAARYCLPLNVCL